MLRLPREKVVPGEFTTSSTAGMQRCNPDDLCGLETFHEKIRMPKLFKLFLRCSIGFFQKISFLAARCSFSSGFSGLLVKGQFGMMPNRPNITIYKWEYTLHIYICI